MRYKIYTDGAYSQIHDEGAFAYVILDANDNEIERKAYKITNETNNRAELKAIIAGVNKLPLDADAVEIYSDSQYALKTLSGEWGHNNNHDLFDVWRSLMISRTNFTSISYNWVRGHNGNKYNEICDQLCNDVLGYDANVEFEKYRKNKSTSTSNNEKDVWIKRMKECDNLGREDGHREADTILCELVNKYCPFGEEIVNEFDYLLKWYA